MTGDPRIRGKNETVEKELRSVEDGLQLTKKKLKSIEKDNDFLLGRVERQDKTIEKDDVLIEELKASLKSKEEIEQMVWKVRIRLPAFFGGSNMKLTCLQMKSLKAGRLSQRPVWAMLSKNHRGYRNSEDEATVLVEGPTLDEIYERSSSKSTGDCEELRSHEWKLKMTTKNKDDSRPSSPLPTKTSKVVESDLGNPSSPKEDDAMFGVEQVVRSPPADALSIQSDSTKADTGRTVDSKLSTTPTGPKHGSKRGRVSGDDDSVLGAKKTCRPCYKSKDWCDGKAQCATCTKKGLQCVRMACSAGATCTYKFKCALVHPEEEDAYGVVLGAHKKMRKDVDNCYRQFDK